MTDLTIRTATCGCSSPSIAATGTPAHTLLCSCRSCQAHTGSGIGVSAYWPAGEVQVSGPSTAWTRDCQDDRHAEHHFCPTCGTTGWWTIDFAQGQIGVAGGKYEDSDFLKPEIAFWSCYRPAWVGNISTTKTLDRQSS